MGRRRQLVLEHHRAPVVAERRRRRGERAVPRPRHPGHLGRRRHELVRPVRLQHEHDGRHAVRRRRRHERRRAGAERHGGRDGELHRRADVLRRDTGDRLRSAGHVPDGEQRQLRQLLPRRLLREHGESRVRPRRRRRAARLGRGHRLGSAGLVQLQHRIRDHARRDESGRAALAVARLRLAVRARRPETRPSAASPARAHRRATPSAPRRAAPRGTASSSPAARGARSTPSTRAPTAARPGSRRTGT